MAVLLQKEIELLERKVLALCAQVESNLTDAVRSVLNEDAKMATKVIAADREVDVSEVEIEEDCLKILALHQPVASDLRYIIAVLKLNNDLERIGDLGVSIAENALRMAKGSHINCCIEIEAMSLKVREMMRNAINALVTSDSELAKKVCASDDTVDDYLRAAYKTLRSCVRENPEQLNPMLSLLSVARNLERVADHVTNIAEDVIYMSEGEIIRHEHIE